MPKHYFADASRARVQITKAQQKAIEKMYIELAEEIADETKLLQQRSNISSILRSQYLGNLSSQIKQELNSMSFKQNELIRKNMASVAASVVKDNAILLETMHINVTGAYSYIPSEIVKSVASGKLYKERWNLSSSIWQNIQHTKRDIDRVVAKGIAGQKSTYEIAKDLEKYVNPKARKDWEWSKIYPGTAKVVDYNAQRLARTMVSHAYQDSIVRTTKNNPFVECYQWMTSNSDRVCEICQERESGFHGVVINGKSMYGCYYAEDLPLDHPNGMCVVDTIIEDLNDVADRLADWVNGKDDEALDSFAEDLGFSSETLKSKVSN